jgi:hypothetical protein
MRRRNRCRCTGDPQQDPCAYCEGRIAAAEYERDHPVDSPEEADRMAEREADLHARMVDRLWDGRD